MCFDNNGKMPALSCQQRFAGDMASARNGKILPLPPCKGRFLASITRLLRRFKTPCDYFLSVRYRHLRDKQPIAGNNIPRTCQLQTPAKSISSRVCKSIHPVRRYGGKQQHAVQIRLHHWPRIRSTAVSYCPLSSSWKHQTHVHGRKLWVIDPATGSLPAYSNGLRWWCCTWSLADRLQCRHCFPSVLSPVQSMPSLYFHIRVQCI